MSLNVGAPSTKVLVIPSPHIDDRGAFAIPLIAIGGELLAVAATANQALTAAAPSGTLAFITDLFVMVTATAAAAGSLSLLDASGGNVLAKVTYNAAGPTLHDKVFMKFTIPHKTAAAGGQFFITTAGAGVTFSVQANGFFASIL